MTDGKTEQIQQVRLPFDVKNFDFRELAAFIRSVDPAWLRADKVCEQPAHNDLPLPAQTLPELRD